MMKKLADVKSYFSLKRTSFLMCLLLVFCSSGVFGGNYLSSDVSGAWNNDSNGWKTKGLGWNGVSNHPNNDDSAYFSGSQSVTLYLTENISLNDLIISYYELGVANNDSTITINLNGYSLDCEKLILGNNNANNEKNAANLVFTNEAVPGVAAGPGSSTVTVTDSIDYANNVNSSLSIINGVSFIGTGATYNGVPSGNSGKLNILGDGTGTVTLPASANSDPGLSLENTWTGASDNDWSNPANWTGGVPSATSVITISASPSGGRFPNITADSVCKILTLEEGAEISSSAGTTFTVDSIAGNGKLKFNGSVSANSSVVCKSLENSSLFSCSSLTVNQDYTGQNGSSITCSSFLKIDGGVMLRGNVKAESVEVGGKLSFGGACAYVETTGNQLYKDEVMLLRTEDAVKLYSKNNGTVQIDGQLINWSDDATGRSIDIGTPTYKTKFVSSKIGNNNNIGNLTIHGDWTSTKVVKASEITVDGKTTISANISSSGGQTYSDAVTINDDIILSALANTITFNSTVNGDVSGRNLQIGKATEATKVIFNKNVGSVNALADLSFYGDLSLANSVSVNVENWKNQGTGTMSCGTGSEVTVNSNVTGNNSFNKLIIEGSGTSSFDGNNTISDFLCRIPGKTLEFKSGKTQTILSTFTVNGLASDTQITLKSDKNTKTAGDRWIIDNTSANSFVSYAKIENSQAVKLITPSDSSNLGNNINWSIYAEYKWSGEGANSDWGNPLNWLIKNGSDWNVPVIYPGESSTEDSVTISTTASGTGKWPIYTYEKDIEIKKLVIGDPDAEFTLNSANNITVNNSTSPIVNTGKIIFKNTGRLKNLSDDSIMDTAQGTVEYSGSADMVTNYGSSSANDYNNLIVKTSIPLEGGHQIKVAGNFILDGADITTGGQSLYVAGTSSIDGNIETDHDQTYVGKVTFTGTSSTLIATAVRADTTPYRVIFNNAVEGAAGGTDLTFKNVTFAGELTNIKKLTVNEATINNGTIQTSGLQTYFGNVSGTGQIKVPELASGTAVIFAGGFECRTLTGAETQNPVIVFRGGDVTFTNFTHNNDSIQFDPSVSDINLNTGNNTLYDISIENQTNKVLLKSALTANNITVKGKFEVETGRSYVITANGDWNHSAATASFVPENSTVKVANDVLGSTNFYKLVIEGSSDSTSKITGSNTIDTFTCTVPKKTLIFTAGTTQTISTVTINSSAGDEITLKSATSGSEWKIDVPVTTVSNVVVSDSNAISGTITANSSISKGGNTNWNIPGTYYWTGSTDTAWNKSENWEVGFNSGKVTASIWPGQFGNDDTVYISAETLATGKDYPKFNETSDISLKNLYLGDSSHNAQVSLINSGSVQIAATFSNYGIVTYKSTGRIKNTSSVVLCDISHNGSVEFNGTGLIIDDIGANDYYNLILSGSAKLGGNIRVIGSTTLSADASITTDDPSYSISFAAIQNASSHNLSLGDSSHPTNVIFTGNIGTESEPIGKLTVNGDATFSGAITINSNNVITFANAISPSYKLTINKATVINFAGDNTFANLEVSGKTQVNFDADSFQKFTYLKLTGQDATNRLVFGGTSDWNINLPGKAYGTFAYTTIQKSTSKSADNLAFNELEYTPSSDTLLEASIGSAVAWFEHKYYWFGTAADKWTASGKWFYDEAKTIQSPVPVYTDGTSKIILKDNLDIEKDTSITQVTLSLLSLTIDSGKRFALKDKNLTLALPGSRGNALENNGTFALNGMNGQTVSFTGAGGKSSHGDSSVIEYYGTGDSEDVFAVASGATNTYKTIKVSKTAGTMSFNKGFTADSFASEDTNAVLQFKGDFTISSETEFNQKIDVQKNNLGITVSGTNTLVFNKDVTTSNAFTVQGINLIANTKIKKGFSFNNLSVAGGKSLDIESTVFYCEDLYFIAPGTTTLSVTNPSAAYIKNITIYSGCTLTTASTFAVRGKWNNLGSFEATAGTITFDSDAIGMLIPGYLTESTISGNNTFWDVNIYSKDITTVSGSNSYQNLTIKHANGNIVNKVQFGRHQTQTINKTLTVTGSASDKILLTTDAATPSTTNTNTWWQLAGIPQYSTANWAGDQKINATYAQIQYCAAANNLTHDWGTGLASMAMALSEGADESTSNLFIRTFYWYGGTDSLWSKPSNWSAQEDSEVQLVMMTPPYDANTARIVIVKSENDSGYNTLKLSKAPAAAIDYKIKSFTVKEGAIVDLGDSSLTLKTDEKLTNNGRIKMSGTQSLNVSGSGTRVNGADSTIEYYGDCSSMPWGQFYQNLEFTSGAKTTSAYSSALSVSGTTKFTNGSNNSIILSGANNFNNPLTITSGGNLTINANSSGVRINDGSTCTSLTIQSKATLLGSVTTTGNQTYDGAVTLNDDVNLIAYNNTPVTIGQVDFNSTVSGDKKLSLGDSSHQTNASFAGTVSINSLEVYGTTFASANITTTNAQIYKDKLTWKNAVKLSTGDSSYVQFNGGAVPDAGETNVLNVASVTYLTGAGDFGGGSGIELTKNVFVANITATKTISIKDNVKAKADMYISSETTGTLNISSPVDISGNFALFNGKVNANANITAGKDIVLLSGSGTTDGDGTSGTSGKEIFVYNLTDRPKAASLNIVTLSPPSSITFNTATYNSTLSPASSITIQAGQNFFDNGVFLSGAGAWNLKLKDNTDSKDAFAEIYNATVKNCQVSAISGTAYLAAAEATNGTGNNANVCFTRPKIKTAYTEYDDVIKIEFWDGTNLLEIENTNNEIWTEFTTRAWYGNDGQMVQFAGTYTDKECKTGDETTGKGNMSAFYLKVENKWNTDATGSSAGAVESTDRSGTHRKAVPYINLPKALTDSYLGLKDVHKNRVASYYTAPAADGVTLSPLSSNAAPGKTYTATEDGCAPVLVAVRTGREKHIDPHSTTPTQKQYDAHNFIEFAYSEPVDVGTVGDYNTGSTAALGDIRTEGTELLVSGFATLQHGFVDAASKAAKPVHSLYRKFDTGSGEAVQNHRVRIAIAGYVDGNITVNGKTYFNWTSYIESAQMPSGDVSRIANANIKDRTTRTVKNSVPSLGTTEHPLPDLSVINNQDINLYGSWDVTPPSFVPLRLNGTEWKPELENADQYEAVGAAYSGHAYLDSIEVHMFDDQPTYTAYSSTTAGDGSTIETGEKNQWFSKIGWDDVQINNRNNAGTNLTPAANQRGGIRYSSIYNIASSFKYHEYDDVTFLSFANKNLEGGAESSVFTPAAGTANSALNEDGCYYKIYFPAGTNLDPKLKFMLSFNADSVYLTDLAGNRIRNRASGDYYIPTVDRTPPAINMTATPCGKDELYIVFAKSIKTDPYKVYKDADNWTEITNPLEYIPKALKILGSTPVQIDTSRPAKLVHRTFNSTGFIVYLDKEVDWQDIKTGYIVEIIKTTNPDHRYDPLSGVIADVTYIQDDMGNYASAGSKHTLTDFAVNVVDVEYAYNENINDTSGNNIQQGLYENGSWAVHDWSQAQGNYGVLNPNYDVFMRTKFFDGTTDNSKGAANINLLTMRFDENPDINAVSSEYNSFSGRQWRIWLPEPYTNIAPAGNNTADSLSVGPTALADDDNPYHFDFEIPFKTGSLPEYGDSDTVSFLFEITDNGNVVKVDHFCNGALQPLYALRLSDPNDSSSLDLWSFKLRDTVRQRGGISILNNVINPLEGEKTVIRTDFNEETSVSIMVMTLDGNIVTYLNRGAIPAGEQYITWDGCNTNGSVVARGLYFIRFIGSGIDETRKVMIVK